MFPFISFIMQSVRGFGARLPTSSLWSTSSSAVKGKKKTSEKIVKRKKKTKRKGRRTTDLPWS